MATWAMAALLLVAACGNNSPSGSSAPAKILYLTDLTGQVADIGKGASSGFKTAIDWANTHGGVNGHQIKLTIANDASDEQKGRVAFDSAVADGNLGIFGGFEANVWAPLVPLAARNKTLEVGVGFSDSSIEPPQPYVYVVNTSQKADADLMVSFVKSELVKNGSVPASPRAAILGFASVFTTTIMNFLKTDITKEGWKNVAEQTFDPAAIDLTNQASVVARANPDVVFAFLLDSDAKLAVSALRQQGYRGPVVDFTGASSPATLVAVNDAGYYTMRFVNVLNDTSLPGIADVLARARATNNVEGIDGGWWPIGYLQGLLAVAALKGCADPCTPEKYNTAFENMGKVDASGLVDDMQVTPARHRAVTNGIFYHFDTTQKKEVSVGGWQKPPA
jgi:ABC-type branched-subunit amino acid transport system substrate-binding protein